MQQDVQTYLKQFEAQYPNKVRHIHELVPRDYFTTAATLEVERTSEDPPVLIFHNVNELEMPVITGMFSSRDRIAHAIGTVKGQLSAHWAKISENLIKPVVVESGVCQEVCAIGDEADARTLPLMAHFEQDAGRYITSGVIAANDPDTGDGNLSFARMQLQGKDQFGISVHSRGHLWDYHRRAEAQGKDLEVAVIIGMHPAFLIGAASRVGIEVDEYDVAGALLGEPIEVVPCKTVNLNVPAYAEIVLEGVMLANQHGDEGPFGEYTGYATSRSTRNIFKLKAITRRKNPYFLDVCPGLSRDHLFLGRVHKEAEVLRKLRQVLPNVKAIHYPVSGSHYHCYISIAKQRPGDGRHAAILALGLDSYIKLAVVVDDDIDVSNESEVMWALATRMQPAKDTIIIDEMTCNVLDPSSHNGLSSKLLIDATRPLEGWDAARCTVPEEMTENIRQMFGHFVDSG